MPFLCSIRTVVSNLRRCPQPKGDLHTKLKRRILIATAMRCLNLSPLAYGVLFLWGSHDVRLRPPRPRRPGPFPISFEIRERQRGTLHDQQAQQFNCDLARHGKIAVSRCHSHGHADEGPISKTQSMRIFCQITAPNAEGLGDTVQQAIRQVEAGVTRLSIRILRWVLSFFFLLIPVITTFNAALK